MNELHAEDRDTSHHDVILWLDQWAEMVRSQRFEEAQGLFALDVHGFGTVMTAVTGREKLLHGQWQAVWPRTRAFRFRPETAHVWADGQVRAVAVQWSSEGLDPHTGEPYPRSGRATVVLQRQPSGWRAVHTHFSIDPAPERFIMSRQSTSGAHSQETHGQLGHD